MTLTATLTRASWVVCHEYAAGPLTETEATRLLDTFAGDSTGPQAKWPCHFEHRLVHSGVKPTTARDLALLLGEDPHAAYARDAAADLADAWLAAPLRTAGGTLTVVQGGWSDQAAAAADAAGPEGTPAWYAALGRREYVILTADARTVELDKNREPTWCQCTGAHADRQGWVRFEKWTGAGRVRHGFACAACRRMLQNGGEA